MNGQMDNVTALDARDALLWIASRWPALQTRLRPGGGNALNGMPRGNDKPLPIDTHVSDLMHEIENNVARFYGQILMDETEWQPATSSMPGLLVEVAQRYGHFVKADDAMALGFCDDAEEYRHKVQRVLERPAPPMFVGPCSADNCEGELRLHENVVAGKCPVCGKEFTLIGQRAWLEEQMEGRLMTVSEIVSALLVLGHETPVGTVKSWVARKKLVADEDSGLYRLAQARDLAKGRKAA